jgi:signal transduction histidine kinase
MMEAFSVVAKGDMSMTRNRGFLLVPVLAVGVVLAAAPLAAEDLPDAYPLENGVNQDLVKWVDMAAARVEKAGMEACKAFHSSKGDPRLGEGYVFMLDMEGVAVCHPGRPQMEGQNVLEMRDPDGKELGKLFRQRAESPAKSGWVHYLWPRPGDDVMTWKSTYVRRVTGPDEIDYMVASGRHGLPMEKQFVVERVDDAVALIQAKGQDAFPIIESPSEGFEFLDTYVFVVDRSGVELVNPAFPELEGESVLEVKDLEGTYPVQEMLAALEEAERAWVSYFWPRPRSTRPAKKDVYVRRVDVDEASYIVGAGLYSHYAPAIIDDPAKKVEKEGGQ